jgi:hypothetical protein
MDFQVEQFLAIDRSVYSLERSATKTRATKSSPQTQV